MISIHGINTLHIIAFTHRNLAVGEIGLAHIEEENQATRLTGLKESMALTELMFLSTCNRIEFTFCCTQTVDPLFVQSLLTHLYPSLSEETIGRLSAAADIFNGVEAVEHSLRVASSIESMVVGEREIITQVRNAFDASHAMKLTGDTLRILVRHTIETAKKVYTKTNIARRPVSVVSLAYHRLKDLNVPLDARVLIIGAGVTNNNMGRFLRKHGFSNFTVFNRTVKKAEMLAQDLNGVAYSLHELTSYSKGFDIIISCTGSESHILTPEIYTQLLQEETDRKVVIDIAIPQDLSPEIVAKHNVNHISVEVLQKISAQNLKERSKEVQSVELILSDALTDFLAIYKERSVELAMREVPTKVKEIKDVALNQVFKNDIGSMDENSRELLERVIQYMEKKYISMPMLMAKDILLKKTP